MVTRRVNSPGNSCVSAAGERSSADFVRFRLTASPKADRFLLKSGAVEQGGGKRLSDKLPRPRDSGKTLDRHKPHNSNDD